MAAAACWLRHRRDSFFPVASVAEARPAADQPEPAEDPLIKFRVHTINLTLTTNVILITFSMLITFYSSDISYFI